MQSANRKNNKAAPVYLVSSCLVGLLTRYDGEVKAVPSVFDLLAGVNWLPICPEQLGGLATPRPPADLVGGDGYDVLKGKARVLTREGDDVTANFIRGAEQVLAIARAQKVAAIYLKARSPSCGLIPVVGVTAALLKEHGYTVHQI